MSSKIRDIARKMLVHAIGHEAGQPTSEDDCRRMFPDWDNLVDAMVADIGEDIEEFGLSECDRTWRNTPAECYVSWYAAGLYANWKFDDSEE